MIYGKKKSGQGVLRLPPAPPWLGANPKTPVDLDIVLIRPQSTPTNWIDTLNYEEEDALRFSVCVYREHLQIITEVHSQNGDLGTETGQSLAIYSQ